MGTVNEKTACRVIGSFSLWGLSLFLGSILSSEATAQPAEKVRSIFISAPEWRAKVDSLYPSGHGNIHFHRLLGSFYPLKADSLGLRQLIENGQASVRKRKKVSRSSRGVEAAEKPTGMPIKLLDTTLTIICDTITILKGAVYMNELGTLPLEEIYILRGRVLGSQGGVVRLKIGPNSISGQLEFQRQPVEYRNSWRMKASYLFDIRYLGPPGLHSLVYSMNLED